MSDLSPSSPDSTKEQLSENPVASDQQEDSELDDSKPLHWSQKRCQWFNESVVVLILATTVATAVWYARPDKYTSYALIRIAGSEMKVFYSPSHPVENDATFVRTQASLIRSKPVLRQVLKDEKIRYLPLVMKQPEPIEWLEKELKLEQIDGTEIFRLSLAVRSDGADLMPIVKAATEAYIAEVVEEEHKVQLARLDELQKVYSAVEEKNRNLRETVRGMDSKFLSLRRQILIDEYTDLKRDLKLSIRRDRELEIKLAIQSKPRANPTKVGEALEDIETERAILKQQREAIQTEITTLQTEVDRLGLNSIEVDLRKSEIERSDMLLKAIWEQRERMEIELNGSRKRVTVFSPAEEAEILNKYEHIQETAGAGVVVLCLGMCVVGIRGLRRSLAARL